MSRGQGRERPELVRRPGTIVGVNRGRVLAAVVVLLAAAYVYSVPLGEAPDEAAHLRYLEEVAAGSLPRFAPGRDALGYEAHQPPLDYLVVAAVAKVFGALPVGGSFEANPDFDFHARGSRAFLAGETPSDSARRFRRVRLVRAGWLLPTILLLLGTARRLERSDGPSLAGFAAVALVPQLLFVSATVNNDGAVTLFSCAAFLLLAKLVTAETPALADAGLAGAAAALAVLSKGTGLALLGPIGFASIALWRRVRCPSLLAALSAPLAAGVAALIALNALRFGSPGFRLPAEPGHEATTALRRLVEEPDWIVTLGGSFWARFGWFNLPLPAPAYLLFVPAIVLALAGLGVAFRRATGDPEERLDVRRSRLAASMIAANLAIVVGHMVLVAWQPQGRLLLPSLGALCVLVVVGLRRVTNRAGEAKARALRATIPGLIIVLGLAANGISILWILRAYG